MPEPAFVQLHLGKSVHLEREVADFQLFSVESRLNLSDDGRRVREDVLRFEQGRLEEIAKRRDLFAVRQDDASDPTFAGFVENGAELGAAVFQFLQRARNRVDLFVEALELALETAALFRDLNFAGGRA